MTEAQLAVEDEANVWLAPYTGKRNGIYTERQLQRQERTHNKTATLYSLIQHQFTLQSFNEFDAMCKVEVLKTAEQIGMEASTLMILRLSLQGHSSREIGATIGYSHSTVLHRLDYAERRLKRANNDVWAVIADVFAMRYELVKAYCTGVIR